MQESRSSKWLGSFQRESFPFSEESHPGHTHALADVTSNSKCYKMEIVDHIGISSVSKLTLIGGFWVMCDTRKFIAISSQFVTLSTRSRIASGISCV